MRLAALSLVGVALLASPASAQAPGPAVGAQYDTTHVYVAPADMGPFAAAFTAAFGGAAGKPAVVHVTPTPSSAQWQAISTPAGAVSLFGFTTPVPWPFGAERTGYLVRDMDGAIAAARAAGADIVVAPFKDPIGRDAIIEWPGGVDMQLYTHDTPPNAPALARIPENRVYVSPGRAEAFVRAFLAFSHGRVIEEVSRAPGLEIGRPGETFREIRMTSGFGRMTVLVTDGHLPFPYGRETTGYDVTDLAGTLARATGAGATILVAPYDSRGRRAAMVEFPGGYIAEIHAVAGR